MIQQNDQNEKNLLTEKYAGAREERARQIEEEELSKLPIEERVIEEMNNILAVIHTKSTYILFEKSEKEFVLDSKASMRTFFGTDFITVGGKSVLKFDIWFNSPSRRRFEDIVFDPMQVGHYDGKYNLWKGFAYQPVKGDCSLFLAHMRENICSGNEVHYQYLLYWCAHLIQKPWVIGSAIVLRGFQGTGKGVFVHALGELFGIHYAPLACLDQVLGRFNSHLQHAVLVFADEAIWGGNKRELGALKGMITEKRQFIEAKGKDGYWIDNFKHLIVSSNEEYAVHLDPDDRRFFVLNVSSQRKEDGKYFKVIQDQLKNGGYEALMYELKNLDLSGFDPRVMPENYAGFDMKLMSTSSIDRYVYASLKEGCWDLAVGIPSGEFKTEIIIDAFYTHYKNWCQWEHQNAVSKEQMGSRLKKIFPMIESKRAPRETSVKRPTFYKFPSFEVCRLSFEKLYKQNSSIWELS